MFRSSSVSLALVSCFHLACSAAPSEGDEELHVGSVTQEYVSYRSTTIDIGSGGELHLQDIRGANAYPSTAFKYNLNLMLDAAVPGTTVRMSTYDWDHYFNGVLSTSWYDDDSDDVGPDCWPAMHDAAVRGVRFKGVINTHPKPGVKDWLLDGGECRLCPGCAPEPTPPSGALDFRECTTGKTGGGSNYGSCLGNYNQHAKLVTFESLDYSSTTLRPPEEHVTVISSHNHDYHAARIHNHAVTIRGDKNIFDGANAFLDAMHVGGGSHDQTVDGSIESTRNASGTLRPVVRAYFFPRDGDNFWLSVLNNVDCTDGGEIKILMGHASDSGKAMAIAGQLKSLADSGCEVSIATGKPGSGAKGAFIDALGQNVHWLRAAGDGLSPIHHKTMIINARYAGGNYKRRLVFTGSVNFTSPALGRNDEAQIRIEHDTAFKWFLTSFNEITEKAFQPGNYADYCLTWAWWRICSPRDPN